jgi:hypothetical protein
MMMRERREGERDRESKMVKGHTHTHTHYLPIKNIMKKILFRKEVTPK